MIIQTRKNMLIHCQMMKMTIQKKIAMELKLKGGTDQDGVIGV
jgi:hypothetical protein